MDDIKDYLNIEQERLESISEEYRKDANGVISELPKHLILTSTVFIALSSSILSINNDIIKNLSILDKLFLIIGLCLLVISIIMGLLQYLLDFHFFKNQVNNKEKIIELIANNTFNNEEEYKKEVEKIQVKKLESHNFPIILQGIFLLLGIISFLVMFCNSLF